ncbi:MAG: hypothetical protein NE330_06525 [Lentisphaeraceae bacterium]|nr:hypothetical protein [Lentisphaeraceae bacterium]
MRRLFLLLFLFTCSIIAEVDNKKLAHTMSRLKQIGTTYAMYFTDGTTDTIPTPEAVEVDESIKTYVHPETGKVDKFIFILPGYRYTGSSDMLLAVTDKPIGGTYMAVFEDGHVESISKEEFTRQKGIFGLIQFKAKSITVDDKLKVELDQLIKQLGASKFRERKAAKKALLKKGSDIISYLDSQKENPDFEISVSIKEIITELTPKIISGKRVPVK